MNKKVTMNSDLFIIIASYCFIIYANYNAIIDIYIKSDIRSMILILMLMMTMWQYFCRKIHISKKQIRIMFYWGLLILIIILNNNYDFSNGNYFLALRVIIAIMLIYIAPLGKIWFKKVPEIVVKIGYLNIIATIILFFIPKLYGAVVSIYGFYPTGTSNGVYGYRAGLANHYSQNGTYIAFVFISLCGLWIINESSVKKKRNKLAVLLFIGFIALLLTTKRAHFLFCILSIAVVYLIIKPERILNRSFKVVIIGCVGIAVLYVIALFVDPVSDLFERLALSGRDSESQARLNMWLLAFKNFQAKSIFGIGWGGFKYQYAINLYKSWQDRSVMYLNAHNVYIQLLCETGIVGLTIFLLAAGSTLSATIKGLRLAYRRNLEIWKKEVLAVSCICQVFFLMYCLTGNCLYDYSIYFYALTASAGMAVMRSGSNRTV